MKKASLFSIGLGVLAVVMSLVMWAKVPAQMPTHWGISGKPDGFMAKELGLWLFPALIALMPLFGWGLLKLDPRKENIAASDSPMGWLFGGIAAFFLGMHGLVLYAATQTSMTLPTAWVLSLVGLLFAGLGVLLPKMKSNWFVGIRTPWTLSSEVVWEKTHRIGGRLMIGAGLLVIPVTFGLPTAAATVVCVALLSVAGLVPVVLSYVFYRQEQTSTSH